MEEKDYFALLVVSNIINFSDGESRWPCVNEYDVCLDNNKKLAKNVLFIIALNNVR